MYTISKILGFSRQNNCLNKIVREILVLQERLHNFENESFYFRKGLESSQRKLKILKEEFEEIKNIINTRTIEELKGKKLSIIKKMSDIRGKEKFVGFCKGLWLDGLHSDLAYVNELIYIKKRYNKLEELEEYMNDSDKLKQFFE
jgi:hypothetical protein